MKKVIKVFLLTMVSIAFLSFITPPKSNWVKLGTKKVNMKADHDEIIVTAKEGVYTKLKFKVVKAPLSIHNIKVVFGNGETKEVIINKKFPKGAESKVIDLPGNKRIIKKIKMNYKTPSNPNGSAIVLVFGKH